MSDVTDQTSQSTVGALPLATAMTLSSRQHSRNPDSRNQIGLARRVFGACAGVVAILCAALAPGGALAQGRPASVEVADVQRQTVSDTRNVIGQIVAQVESAIATRVAGIVESTEVEVGDRLDVGDVIARLDPSEIKLQQRTATAEVEVARAGVDVAQAELRSAEVSFERQAALKNSRAFSRSRFEDLQQQVARARAGVTRASAQLARAQAALAETRYRLEQSIITAPFPGIVLEKQVDTGSYVTVGAPLATMIDLARLEIEANVPVELLTALAPGKTVSATIDGGGTHDAVVRSILPVRSVSTRTGPVRFAFNMGEMPEIQLARGKSVMLALPASGEREVLTVPKDALVQAGNGWIVYAVVDGKAMMRPVEIGLATGDRFEVKSGLTAGDSVIVRGNERIRPGQDVVVARKPASADGAGASADRS